MEGSPLQYFLFVILPVLFLTYAGLYGIFKKAGVEGWKALVPFYNIWIWLDLIGRPKRWFIWFLIPVIGNIMMITITIDLLRSFKIEKFWHHFAAVFFPFFYFPYLGWSQKTVYAGKGHILHKERKEKRSEIREWADALLFAGAAAIIIRTFMFEAFMIPTTSMEGSLLAGDFLFVSKFHYGIRLPMVPLSFPFVHNTLPVVGGKSYTDLVEFPYVRLPGLKDVERNDIVVFNYPADDIIPDPGSPGPVQPTPLKQNYIKRCVAIPGDKLEIRQQDLYINDSKGWESEHAQFRYIVTTTGSFSSKYLQGRGFRFYYDEMGRENSNANVIPMRQFEYAFFMSEGEAKEVESWDVVKDIVKDTGQFAQFMQGEQTYPVQLPIDYGTAYKANFESWTSMDFGPLVVPQEGMKITMNDSTYLLYKRVIEEYEEHTLIKQGTQFILDGSPATEYTFEQDYYWMMGDNRNQSFDSRYWGFVPESHIVGRPWMVAISVENWNFRWDRFFSPITRWEP